MKIIKPENLKTVIESPSKLSELLWKLANMSAKQTAFIMELNEDTIKIFKIKYFKNLVILDCKLLGNFYRYCESLSAKLIRNELSQCKVLKLAKLLKHECNVENLKNKLDIIRVDDHLDKLVHLEQASFLINLEDLSLTSGARKYPELCRILQTISCISHSQAEIEKGFSESLQIMTKLRTRMSEETFNNRKYIKAFVYLHDNDIFKIEITQELLKLAKNSSRLYRLELEDKEKQAKLKWQRMKKKQKEN